MGKPPSKSETTFESALERLEQIVEEMEGDKLPLEELLGRYEEGTRLVKICQERLSSAEKRIELITKNAAGSAELAPFDPSSAPVEMHLPYQFQFLQLLIHNWIILYKDH
jgi:exodeoxyribonuclease VII small subunit